MWATAILRCLTTKRVEKYFERGVIKPLPFRSMHMRKARARIRFWFYNRDGANLAFETKNGVRYLSASFGEFSCNVKLTPVFHESATVCTPFEKRNEFYYNEKVNLLKAEVTASVGETRYEFDPERTFSLLDWGRGVWPFHHSWYWSSASTLLNGKPFGFNLGCGFGDNARVRGTENIVYYGDSFIKLNWVNITSESDPMIPWRLESDDGRFRAVLTPRYDRDSITKLLIVNNRWHQLFGTVAGALGTDSGDSVPFENVVGFAEHAVNHGNSFARNCDQSRFGGSLFI